MNLLEIKQQIKELKEQERKIKEELIIQKYNEKKNEIENRINKIQKGKEIKKTIRICEWCGKDFEFIFKKTHRNHCSKECFRLSYNEKRRSKYTGIYHQNTIINKKCKQCLKDFNTTNSRRIYCSNSCSETSIKEKRKIQPVQKKCKECGKEFIGNGVRKYCSDKCSAIGFKKTTYLYKSLKQNETTANRA